MSKYRKEMSNKNSKKLFTKTAQKTNKKNYAAKPMRGGTRL